MVKEGVTDCAARGVWAVSVRGIAISVEERLFGVGTEIVAQTFRFGSLQILDQMSEALPVLAAGICHELAQLVYSVSNVWSSPASDEVGECNEAAVVKVCSCGSWTVFFGEDHGWLARQLTCILQSAIFARDSNVSIEFAWKMNIRRLFAL